MQLNFKKLGSGEALIILHGFMGSLDNWQSLANEFAKSFEVYLIDARNHGKSPHTSTHSIAEMVDDLFDFMQHQHISKAHIIGHSMGGKVAMQFAVNYPNCVNKLVVADIAAKKYERGHDDVFEALYAIDLTKIATRKQAEEAMLPHVSEFGTRQFLLKNLERLENGTYQWKMNLGVLHRDYDEITQEVKSIMPITIPVLFLKGELSKYIKHEDWEQIQSIFPQAELKEIGKAGHWLHADNPKEFYEKVMAFLCL
ncbi:MAG: alpha/beta fold hydrolase [Bacteroidetes bacterium]|nr:alpha/beta fold hydrolase [Bacteroidota bacterium]